MKNALQVAMTHNNVIASNNTTDNKKLQAFGYPL